MIRELLFPDAAAANFDPSKVPMSVDAILKRCQESKLAAFAVDASVADFTSEQTRTFRASRQNKRDKAHEQEAALAKWYGMRKQDPDAEENAELTIFRLRKYLQPGNFIRSDGLTKNPKYYEIGTIIDHGVAGQRQGSKGKQKKGSLFDELAAKDQEVGFTKRKFRQIQDDKMKKSRNRRYIKLKRDMIKDKVRKLRQKQANTE